MECSLTLAESVALTITQFFERSYGTKVPNKTAANCHILMVLSLGHWECVPRYACVQGMGKRL